VFVVVRSFEKFAEESSLGSSAASQPASEP
jgi:hypothetical protein